MVAKTETDIVEGEATGADEAATEKQTRNATETQGTEGRNSGHVGKGDDLAAQGKVGSHEANWTQASAGDHRMLRSRGKVGEVSYLIELMAHIG